MPGPVPKLFADDDFEDAERHFQSQYDFSSREVIGEGTYGKVFKAQCRQTGESVAMKEMKIFGTEDGVPSTAIREVALLQELCHEHIVRLLDVFCKPSKLVLVFELLESDLKRFMKARSGHLDPRTVRSFAHQLMEGIEYCHSHRVIHRDLKPQNLLIDGGKRIKIADFGLARAFCIPVPKYTHEVVTVWYRPPEILLGSATYSIPVDIWGVGCILAEMATGCPLFAGDSEIGTAFLIFQKFGTPTEETWPGVSKLPDYKSSFPKWRARGWPNIRNTAAQVGTHGMDLLSRLMRYEPKARISARRALQHQYLAESRLGAEG